MSAPLDEVYRDIASAVLDAVGEAITELADGIHASRSRDFGRGVAFATRHVAAAVAAAIEININPLIIQEIP